MRAVVCTDFESSEVKEVETPTPGPGEVLIEVSRVQLSVTECMLYRGTEIAHHDEVAHRIHESNGGAQLFGHEFCGRIMAVGEGVDAYAENDRVYAPGKPYCGECTYCRSNHQHLCDDITSLGFDRPGALAEYVRMPVEPLCTLPDSVSDAEGAALQPMASSVLCTLDADVEPGDTVVVIGAGVMGYQCALLANQFGAETVYAVDVRDRPLELAEQNGVEAIDATETDVVEAVDKATDGIGADVVFEAVGGDQSHATEGGDPIAQAFEVVRRGGTVVQVSHIEGEVDLSPRYLRSKSIRWVNPRKGLVSIQPGTDTGRLAADLVADGEVPIEDYVTHELDGLEEFETAVDITLNKDEYDALGPAQLVLN
ncbi:alcohol dehydrogenase catalytic domain-containing protein (plasmid) [Natrinema zhouii]|uniref:zinc-dependent alcohol dehydrogenase n=1 Tax=Natrinema zhouii TaxID=1710539 RepID=UPI001CFFEB88|nr:alcohol dehydrogenase catalytic domain-containing protein [Natrinema zhouii]UHQ98866.1 alcohol dehydrogenase catalytic domain-containing protein [Natrinema zhouii]